MKNVENLLVNGVSFSTRAEAARHYGINPKLVNERMTKRGWTLEHRAGFGVDDVLLPRKLL